jgi:hypothetical protein
MFRHYSPFTPARRSLQTDSAGTEYMLRRVMGLNISRILYILVHFTSLHWVASWRMQSAACCLLWHCYKSNLQLRSRWLITLNVTDLLSLNVLLFYVLISFFIVQRHIFSWNRRWQWWYIMRGHDLCATYSTDDSYETASASIRSEMLTLRFIQ